MGAIHIKNIEINNYKNFKYFKVDSFKQFNLLFGKNSVGKTNFLESLFLYSGMYNTGKFLSSFTHRDLKFNNDLDIMFYNFDYKTPITINSNNKDFSIYSIESLSSNALDGIYYDVLFDNKRVKIPLLINKDRILEDEFECANFKFIRGKYTIRYTCLKKSIFNIRFMNNVFMTNIEAKGVLLKEFNEIQNIKKDKEIIKILNTIINGVFSIRISNTSTIEIDIGLDRYLPLNSLGEGVLKIFSYIVRALSVKDGVLLIDEIDNGFHHSALRKLWTALFDICFKHNIQIFATTHSYECIDAFREVYNEVREKYNSTDDIQGIRIDADLNEKGKYNPVIYNANRLSSAIEDNFEVR